MDINCTWVNARLGEQLDRTLSPRDRVAVKAHLDVCDACAEALSMTRLLTSELAEMDDIALPTGFSQRLSARLHQEADEIQREGRPRRANHSRRAWWSGLFPALPVKSLAGVAAAVVLVFTAFLMHGERGVAPITSGQTLASAMPVSMGMGGDVQVRIWFESEQQVDHVRFSLQLPPGVRMVSGGRVVDSASLTWEGELRQGRNLIPLQVRGVARGDWTVTASVEKGGISRAKSIDLRVGGA